MNDKVLVSIILFIQQKSNHLSECIDSILSQRLKGWELICVADTNDRESLDVISSYRDKVRLVTVNDSNRVADLVNGTLETANGKYLMFLHPEDFCLPDFLEQGVATAEKNQAQVVVFESGERSPKTGVLRQRFISLQKQILPEMEVFFTLKSKETVCGWSDYCRG